MSVVVALLLAVWAGATAGCAPGFLTTSGSGVVTGTIAYRERMALPADAVIEVSLSDVTEPGEGAKAVGGVRVKPEGRQVPIPFELRFNPGTIVDSHIYVLRAAIRSGGRMIFATDDAYPVLTQGKPTTADLMLVRVGG